MLFIGDGKGPGCFMTKNLGLGDKGRTAYMEFPYSEDGSPSSTFVPHRKRGGIVVTGISTSDSEGVSHLPCFGDKIYTYAFGAKPGSVSVQCMVFLGAEYSATGGATEGQYLRKIMRLYKENRISKSLTTVRVVFPSTTGQSAPAAIRGNLISVQTQTKDPDLGLQSVVFNLVTTEVIGSDQ